MLSSYKESMSKSSLWVLASPDMKKTAKKTTRKPRKTPAQSRSAETVAVIVEAAARVLEERGLEGFNTNAIAERGGISIGSVYQYFRNKDSLLASLHEREAEPFVYALEHLPARVTFQAARFAVIEASVQQQLRRPEPARLLDFVEKQSGFGDLGRNTAYRVQHVMMALLRRKEAPAVEDRPTTALALLRVIRALTDVAGERREKNPSRLVDRIYAAFCGNLGIHAHVS